MTNILNNVLSLSNTSESPLLIYNTTGSNYIWIGKNNENKNKVVFGYKHNSDNNNNNCGLLYNEGDILKFYNDKLEILKPVTVNSTINSWNIPVVTSKAQSTYPALVGIKSDGVCEIGRYLDFHSSESTTDYDCRLQYNGTELNSTKGLSVTGNLTASGTLEGATVGTNLKNAIKSTILEIAFPVGTIYTSIVNTSPATLFGGTWTQITNRFLYCIPSTSTGGSTGGSDKHSHSISFTSGSTTLTTTQIPSHSHNCVAVGNHGHTCVAVGNHTHTIHYGGEHKHGYWNNDGEYSDNANDRWVGSDGQSWHETDAAGNHNHGMDGAGGHGHTIEGAGGHGHTIESTGGGGGHTHGVSGSTAETTTLPPWFGVFAWYRTA